MAVTDHDVPAVDREQATLARTGMGLVALFLLTGILVEQTIDPGPVARALSATVAVLAVALLTERVPAAWTGRSMATRGGPVDIDLPEARARAILDHAGDAIVTVDLDGWVESLNPAAERMFGYAADEVSGREVDLLIEPGDRDPEGGVDARPGHRLLSLERDVTGRRRDGSSFPMELSVTEMGLGDRTIITAIARDVTERKAFEAQLAHQATHDLLTGLPNRVLFMDRLQHALDRRARTHESVAVMFCDLDHFKVVNDSLGHQAGDRLLIAVSERLQAVVRPDDTVARFGGDEFVVLCEELESGDGAREIAERLADALRAPVQLDSGELVISVSIGIALVDDDHPTAETLLRDADAAMYRAKERGRDRHELFDMALRDQAVARLETERDLRRAVAGGEICVHYQPQVDLHTGEITGVEALVRWQVPGQELRPAAGFLAVAEETGLIVPIGGRVMEMACEEAASWPPGPGDRHTRLWVNLSARQLTDPGLADAVTALAAKLPDPSVLGLEIIETDLVAHDDRTTAAVRRLADLGVGIAIDHFGTGLASLTYLWNFPADVLKIDRTFVAGLGQERSATVIVASVTQLARTLDKSVVAEGVETVAQLAQLRRLGCRQAQGRLFSDALPADELRAVLWAPPDYLAMVRHRADDALPD